MFETNPKKNKALRRARNLKKKEDEKKQREEAKKNKVEFCKKCAKERLKAFDEAVALFDKEFEEAKKKLWEERGKKVIASRTEIFKKEFPKKEDCKEHNKN